ncbi:MAG TPA: hypothetical protein VK826_14375 [Bacteroidia bacterium]|nr:hypothetical protein [Bacteroidia bacterium]
MAHQEDSHGHDNDHDNTEGNRQYYPQGWYFPLVGLLALAICFALGAGSLLGISGTDKWGKSSDEGHGHETHQTDDHHGTGDADHHESDHKEPATNHVADSTPVSDSAPKTDSAPKADDHNAHDGHGH